MRNPIKGLDLVGRVGRRWDDLPRPARLSTTALAVIACYALPLFKVPLLDTPKSDFASVLFFPIGVYVLLAIGLNIVVGLTGLLDLGYVAFFAVGAYAMALFGTRAGWDFWLILPVGMFLASFAGLLLGAPTLRLRGDYLAIVTLGFGEIIRITANNTPFVGDSRGINKIPKPPNINAGIGKLEFKLLDPKPYYWLLLTLIVVVVVFVRNLERSRVGRSWTAIREDEDAAELMGVNTFVWKLISFATGAAIGGMAGVVYAAKVGSITPENFPFLLSVLILSAVVLGGSGNMLGVIIGAVLVAYLPERLRFLDELRFLVFGMLLVTLMIYRPQGLIPSRQRTLEMKENTGHGGLGTLGAEVPGE